MKKLFVFVILISLLIPSVAFANGGPSYPKDGGVTCDRVWISITNDGPTNLKVDYGFIYAPDWANMVVSATPGTIVAPGETFELSWTPPQGFADSIYAALNLRDMGSPFKMGRHIVWGNLECHDYELVSDQRNECGGNNYYRITLTDYGQFVPPTLFLSGFFTWSDPFVLESRTFGPFDFGEFGEHPAVTLNEPEECLVVLEHDYEVMIEKDCEGWSTTVVSNDGGVATPLTPTSGTWLDPYTREMAIVTYEIVWPDGYTETVPTRVFEPKRCLVILEHDFEITREADCLGWGFTASSSDGGVAIPQGDEAGAWLDPYTLESASVTYDVTWPDGYTETFSDSVDEPEMCIKSKNFSTELINDCLGFEVIFDISEGGTLVLDEDVALSGIWQDSYKLEAAVVSGKIMWLDESEETFSYIISEPAECFVCKITPLYRMVRMLDYDAPDWYWGEGADNGSCWIIMHEDGTVPSVERQADICSVCVHPDFVYEGDTTVVDDYVTIDCNGIISYPDELWDPIWFRSDYDNICRIPSCINE